VSGVHRALSDPTRRRILQLLRSRDMTAGELAARFDLSASTMSGHFNVLKKADLIQPIRNGTSITYRLNVTVLQEALLELFDMFRLEPRAR
jgi:ArsR family transcriptional regulator, arsenate/arsenite/antimonite-responsive transcriptional repressor